MGEHGGQPLTRRQLLATTGMAIVAGCIDDEETAPVSDDYDHPMPGADPDWEPASGSPLAADVQAETLVENLEIPWDLAFTPNGNLFLTERTGTILRFDSGDLTEITRPADAIDAGAVEPGNDDRPWWVEGGEGGTLGIATHPEFPDERYVYVYYTADGDDPQNRVVRYDVESSEPGTTEEVIVDDIPANLDPGVHNGGRIAFGPDDNLWICTGDAHEPERARDLDSLAGKVLRVAPDGRPLESNPDLDGDPRIFTFGHRNPQGIGWLPDGVPVVSEHGPNTRDELQILRPGEDYGWDDARGGPADEEWGSYTDHPEVVPPVVSTEMTWAPTGLTFYTGDGVPDWHNRFIVAGLISQSLFVVTLAPPGVELPPTAANGAQRYDAEWLDDAYTATAHRVLRHELGRVRCVTQGPDGGLYAITSNRDGRASDPFPRERDDVLVRLTAERDQ